MMFFTEMFSLLVLLKKKELWKMENTMALRFLLLLETKRLNDIQLQMT